MVPSRLEVREQILSCRACDLCRVGSGPVPFTGGSPSRVAVLCEAPGAQEDKQGIPLVGPAGKLLRRAFEEAEIDFDSTFRFNTCSCLSKGPPTPEQITACEGNRQSQLDLADPEWVLVFGNVALSTFRPDLKISKARTHIFSHAGRMWYPTFHPSAALRHRGTEQKLIDDLKLFKIILEHPEPNLLASVDCLVCGVDVEDMAEHDLALHFDEMGGSYCEDCWSKR